MALMAVSLNAQQTQAVFRIDTNRLGSEAEVWEMNHTDLKATNDFGVERVRPAARKVALATANTSFVYTFPRHSLTIL